MRDLEKRLDEINHQKMTGEISHNLAAAKLLRIARGLVRERNDLLNQLKCKRIRTDEFAKLSIDEKLCELHLMLDDLLCNIVVEADFDDIPRWGAVEDMINNLLEEAEKNDENGECARLPEEMNSNS